MNPADENRIPCQTAVLMGRLFFVGVFSDAAGSGTAALPRSFYPKRPEKPPSPPTEKLERFNIFLYIFVIYYAHGRMPCPISACPAALSSRIYRRGKQSET